MRQRPAHLPDFEAPPLDEVVLDVQFDAVPGFAAVHTRDVWGLFKADYPEASERPLLHTEFELFGDASLNTSPGIRVASAPVGSRSWFVSKDGTHLLQYQPDRFVANWRKLSGPAPYPHFEEIAESFRSNLAKLEQHLAAEFADWSLKVKQAEVSYHNIIPVADYAEAGQWVRFWNAARMTVEVVQINFSELVEDKEGKPCARLKVALQPLVTIKDDVRQKAFKLHLAFRGNPGGRGIDSTMRFLAGGRDKIVSRFSELTTAAAHEKWGRTK